MTMTAIAPPPNRNVPLSVTAVVAAARSALERDLGLVLVTGEVSGFTRAASGHCYFSLKDEGAQVRCVMWRTRARLLDFALKDGMAVDIRASATMYEPRGEFQLSVEGIRLAGAGALFERFTRLKAKLEAAGWFDAARKRPIPAFARAVGVVTSTRAAALRDVVTTFARRWPAMRLVVYPCSVQGLAAAQEIADAIALANARREVDVLVVCRGGGSIEDLWAFNEEVVARALFESALPVVSGVGHETDFTIADFVADLRAPTPTGAATLVAPDRAEVAHRCAQLASRLRRAMQHALDTRSQRTDLASRGLVHPRARLEAQRERIAALAARMTFAWRQHDRSRRQARQALAGRLLRELRAPLPQALEVARLAERLRVASARGLERRSARVEALAQNLAHLSPTAVLERGYAIVTRGEGEVVQDAALLAPDDAISITLAKGRAGARITDIEG